MLQRNEVEEEMNTKRKRNNCYVFIDIEKFWNINTNYGWRRILVCCITCIWHVGFESTLDFFCSHLERSLYAQLEIVTYIGSFAHEIRFHLLWFTWSSIPTWTFSQVSCFPHDVICSSGARYMSIKANNIITTTIDMTDFFVYTRE